MAKACIDNCALNHGANCPPLQATSILPDRVIDCLDTSNPKIILTHGEMSGTYVTLSYVWGGPQPMLTTKNVALYTTEGLAMGEFPQSIRDAVTVTHKIGQRYLWIDALCILQDSRADKTTQLGKMHTIYKNSYLTINASLASSTYEGFLHQPRPQREPRATIPSPLPSDYNSKSNPNSNSNKTKISTAFIAYSIPTVTEGPSKTYWDELEPITWRGWCYQEKVLPARSLLYASDTLKYYCQTETVNIGQALCEASTGMRLPYGTYHSPNPELKNTTAYDTLRKSWLAALFQYTLRSISVPTDRLPAFAAVAEQFGILITQPQFQPPFPFSSPPSSNNNYLAGLWRPTLLLDLLWGVESKQSRPEPYRAPSWSWASVDGLIAAEWRFDELARPRDEKGARDLRTATVVDCEVTVASPLAPYGEVTGGLLRLGGLLFRVHSGEGAAETRLAFDSGSGESRDVGPVLVTRDTTEVLSGEELYAVPLLWNIRGSFMCGLVIRRDGGATPLYRRVGRFDEKGSSMDLAWMDTLHRQEISIV